MHQVLLIEDNPGDARLIEEMIRERGAEPAFPVQSSRNHVAAHYCASPEDETRYAEGDLAKLDIGVHIGGFVVDTATTVNLGDRPENRRLVEAARAALEAAIVAAGPGIPIRRVSAAIAATLRSFSARRTTLSASNSPAAVLTASRPLNR